MKVNDLYPSNYLKKEDVPFPTSVTIKHVTQEEISGEGGKELKAIIYFVGNLKPMVLNKGNAITIAEVYGDDTDAWHGKAVEVYTDASVMFAGKRVGGLRLRIPGPASKPAPATSHNGNGFVGRWDLSDGTTAHPNLTAEDVRKTILDSGRPASAWKAKPAGAPREQAKTVDQLGIVTALPPVEDVIPF